MKKTLKVILWVVCIAIVAYIAFGMTKKKAVAPTPEMTGGAGGERAETGLNVDASVENSY